MLLCQHCRTPQTKLNFHRPAVIVMEVTIASVGNGRQPPIYTGDPKIYDDDHRVVLNSHGYAGEANDWWLTCLACDKRIDHEAQGYLLRWMTDKLIVRPVVQHIDSTRDNWDVRTGTSE